LDAISRFGLVLPRLERRTVAAASARTTVTAAPTQIAETLSGGNQQKVLFARSLVRPPKVLIADEPTRGIDIAAKRPIFDILALLASTGVAILLISNELDELHALSDRILVMRRGRIAAELDASEATEDAIMHAAFGTGEATSIAS